MADVAVAMRFAQDGALLMALRSYHQSCLLLPIHRGLETDQPVSKAPIQIRSRPLTRISAWKRPVHKRRLCPETLTRSQKLT